MGKRDACTLTDPQLGIVKISFGKIKPYATTTITSGLIFLIFSISKLENDSGISSYKGEELGNSDLFIIDIKQIHI